MGIKTLLVLLGIAPLFAGIALGHDGENHDGGISVQATPDSAPDIPLDFGGEFELVNHHGDTVTDRSYSGKHMLVFFGYASCKNMCSITLTRIGKALELLGDDVNRLSPVVITVDPERDTTESMRDDLAKYHPQLIGHTGNPEQLEAAYDAFNQQPQSAGTDWNNDPIISHSSYIFLMDADGDFVTLFPPILNPQSMADIISKHLGSAS